MTSRSPFLCHSRVTSAHRDCLVEPSPRPTPVRRPGLGPPARVAPPNASTRSGRTPRQRRQSGEVSSRPPVIASPSSLPPRLGNHGVSSGPCSGRARYVAKATPAPTAPRKSAAPTIDTRAPSRWLATLIPNRPRPATQLPSRIAFDIPSEESGRRGRVHQGPSVGGRRRRCAGPDALRLATAQGCRVDHQRAPVPPPRPGRATWPARSLNPCPSSFW